ncbi:MAG: TIGR03546 family protein [Thalassotalea sp.]
MLTLLVKLFTALNSDSSPKQISVALMLGMIAGFSPLFCLHNFVIFFLVLFIRVHLGSFLLALGFFSGVGYLLSPLFVSVGEAVLTAESLQGLFTSLYQLNLFKLAHWHHTFTLGALISGLILAIPGYFIANMLVLKYRQHIKSFFEKFRVVKALKASKFYRLYSAVSGQGV